MDIGIDITPAVNQTAGIARYTKQLVLNLLNIDKENCYFLYSFFGKNNRQLFKKTPANLKLYNYPAQSFKAFLFLLKTFNKSPDFLIKEANVMHSTDFMLPTSKKKPSVLTVHDLIFLRYPDFYTWKNRTYMKSMANFSTKRAGAIISYSEATKKDLIDILNVNENKIRVIPLGVNDYFKPSSAEKIRATLKKYKIPTDYLLTVGTIEPRKNLTRLLQAFKKLKKDKGFSHKLVITGKKGWGYKNFFNQLERLNLANEVILTGYVEDSDLPALYSSASVFIYPSLYEGFGLPALEAMACGTPVVCSNRSSLPEVAGQAAILINPYESEEIYFAIKKIIEDNSLAEDLRKKGLEQAKRFTWKNTAQKTLDLYLSFS